MSWQKDIRMKIGYRLIGNSVASLTSAGHFKYIENKIPQEFLGRNISDLGCGDGHATRKIMRLFKTKKIKGYEVNRYLVAKARKRGLAVEQTDLGKEVPKGEMATVWGVVHHLQNQEAFLKKIRANFRFAVFNEPVKGFWAFLDGGEPKKEKEWRMLFEKVLGKCEYLRFKDSLFVFWKK